MAVNFRTTSDTLLNLGCRGCPWYQVGVTDTHIQMAKFCWDICGADRSLGEGMSEAGFVGGRGGGV